MLKDFTEQKNAEFEKAYSDFLTSLNDRIQENQNKLNDIKVQAENEIVNYYKTDLNGNKIKLEDIKIQNEVAVSDNLKQQIYILENEYKLLVETIENVKENKDFFVKRIFYYLEPQVYSNLDFLRNIILSIFVGLILAVITSSIVNIYNQRKGKVNSY